MFEGGPKSTRTEVGMALVVLKIITELELTQFIKHVFQI